MRHLSGDPLAVGSFLRCAGQLLDYRELGEAFVQLSRKGLLHADAMMVALDAVLGLDGA